MDVNSFLDAGREWAKAQGFRPDPNTFGPSLAWHDGGHALTGCPPTLLGEVAQAAWEEYMLYPDQEEELTIKEIKKSGPYQSTLLEHGEEAALLAIKEGKRLALSTDLGEFYPTWQLGIEGMYYNKPQLSRPPEENELFDYEYDTDDDGGFGDYF